MRHTLAIQGQEFYSTLAADAANVLCTGHAWKLLAALPEPWEVQATDTPAPLTTQLIVWKLFESPLAAPVEFLLP